MKDISKEEMQDLLLQQRTAVLYFYTPMCGTCQVAGKMLSVVEQVLNGFTYGKVDLNYMPTVAEEFSIESVPCLIVVKDGEIKEKLYAFHSVPYLHEVLLKYM